MISTQDNFLSEFELAFHRRNLGLRLDEQFLLDHGQWREATNLDSGEIDDVRSYLGIGWFSTCRRVKEFALDQLNLDLQPFSFRIQATTDSYRIHPHTDGSVRGRPLDQSFSSIIYLNEDWDESYGGSFATATHTVEPLPNRLVIYSRDELHWVEPAKMPWPKPRTMILISWNTK